jgi:hypothetical protein
MRNSKFNKDGLWRFLVAKSEGQKKRKNHHIHIFDFHCVAKDIQG